MYLPYRYSEDTQYNVFYLMNGGWSDETAYLGTPKNPGGFKNVLDHAMEEGKIRLTDHYHNELVNDLIPAVEGAYSTYAEDTTLEGIRASRDHRAFCGFSINKLARKA